MTVCVRIAAVLAVAFSSVRSPGGSARLAPADQILSKCLESYDAARTFQGELKITSRTRTGRASVTIRLKAESAANGTIARSSLTITSTGEGELAKSMPAQQIIDDGTEVHVVYPEQKQYSSGPRGADRVSGLLRRSFTNVQQFGGKPSVTIGRVNGRLTYILRYRLADGTAQVRIDKITFQMHSMQIERGKPPTRETFDLLLANQRLDEPITADTFMWKAPADYVELPVTPAEKP